MGGLAIGGAVHTHLLASLEVARRAEHDGRVGGAVGGDGGDGGGDGECGADGGDGGRRGDDAASHRDDAAKCSRIASMSAPMYE